MPDFEIRHDQYSGAARHQRGDPLGFRGFHIDSIIHGERAIDKASLDLATLGHLCQNGGIERGRDFGGDRLDRGKHANPRLFHAKCQCQIDCVLGDVDLVLQIGGDVDRGVGDQQQVIEARNVHDENMGQPPRAAQAAILLHDLMQQLVRVQMALHDRLSQALQDQRDGLGRCLVRAAGLDHLVARYVAARSFRRFLDQAPVANQDRLDDAQLRRHDRALQGMRFLRRHDCGAQRLAASAPSRSGHRNAGAAL